jgi:hypothetical protein
VNFQNTGQCLLRYCEVINSKKRCVCVCADGGPVHAGVLD